MKSAKSIDLVLKPVESIIQKKITIILPEKGFHFLREDIWGRLIHIISMISGDCQLFTLLSAMLIRIILRNYKLIYL